MLLTTLFIFMYYLTASLTFHRPDRLSKPVGALNDDRLEQILLRFNQVCAMCGFARGPQMAGAIVAPTIGPNNVIIIIQIAPHTNKEDSSCRVLDAFSPQ
jgi:hypothetical protein